jgi:hypothetical protein
MISVIAANTQNLARFQRCEEFGARKRLTQCGILRPRGKGKRAASGGHRRFIAEQCDHIARDDLSTKVSLTGGAHRGG